MKKLVQSKMKNDRIILFIAAAVAAFILFMVMREGYNKEGYSNDLSDISGVWNVYNYTGYDYKNHPAGKISIKDNKSNALTVTLMDGSVKMATVSPARTSQILQAWVGPVHQLTPTTIEFTFTPQRQGYWGGGMMVFGNGQEYILEPNM
jgi:hypothetical protein